MRKYSLLFLWCLIIAIIIVFLYHRILPTYLVADDYEWWRVVIGLDFIDSFRLFFPFELGGIELNTYYRPVVGWILWLITVVLPTSPITFHLTSLIFHYINALLVGVIALRSFGHVKAALLASLLFAVFPFHSEAVNYIMYNTVMTTFYLLSFISVIRYSRTRSIMWAGIACVTFLLALMSFDSAMTLPLTAILFLLIYQRINLKMFHRQYKYFLLSLFFVFCVYFIIRSIVMHTANPYASTGYMNASFAINNVFKLYCGILVILFTLRIFAKKLFRTFVIKEHIFWFYCILLGLLFLPTFYIPTQERHLYLPSIAFILVLSSFMISLDERLKNANQPIRIILWATIACII
ncbi:MAG: glycosyltransferase family 39 protein, partial [Candidatus Levybacteria bacterium]|nr:glycosyltransferase family 39 protein [Candidatus Levybacteria bacterium]